ncbi:MAG: tetratricopeptide repeat protein [Pirellulaceae bacterium]
MTQSRKEQLQALLAADPDDAFLRYGLAMEFRKEQAYDQARPLFEQLRTKRPPYVPAFFMLGQMLVEMGEVEEARTALRKGIDTARAQGDTHAAGEMSELLMALGSED